MTPRGRQRAKENSGSERPEILEMITLSEGSQTEKDKYHEIAIQGEKTHRNLFTKQTHRLENRLMVTKGKGRGERE